MQEKINEMLDTVPDVADYLNEQIDEIPDKYRGKMAEMMVSVLEYIPENALPQLQRGLDNGYIKDSDREYYYGDTARAECFKGYNMIGNNVLTCSEDQTFAGVPTCEDKDECAQGQVRAVFFGLFFALNGD